jgi:hypothetical protein
MKLKFLFLKTLNEWTMTSHAFSTADFLPRYLEFLLTCIVFLFFAWAFPLYASHVRCVPFVLFL